MKIDIYLGPEGATVTVGCAGCHVELSMPVPFDALPGMVRVLLAGTIESSETEPAASLEVEGNYYCPSCDPSAGIVRGLCIVEN